MMSTAIHPPLTGKKLVIGTIAVALATFMAVLDTTIAIVSIPVIAGDIGIPPNQGTWIIIVFVVANAITLPLTGWLTQRFGIVRLFVLSIVGFSITSFMCGVSPTVEVLLVSRFLQGAVSGPMIPLSQALLLSAFPKHKAGQALAIWSMTAVIAPVFGPILGGIITDEYSWPWIFYINVPIGMIVAIVCWYIFNPRETPTKNIPVDLVGLILLIVWVSALQVMLENGLELNWFASGKITFLAATAALFLIMFVFWELTHHAPIVELRLFKRRNFIFSVLSLGVGYGLFLATVVLIPLWLQTRMEYTATWAGYATAPIGFFAILLSPWIGKKVGHMDSRILATWSFIIFIIAMLMRTQFTLQVDFISVMLPQLVQGAAIALFFAPLTNLSLIGLKPHEIPLASGLSNFIRITCGAIFISIATSLWDLRTSHHYARLMENITSQNFNVVSAKIQTVSTSNSSELVIIERMVSDQAAMLALNDFFYIQSLSFLMLIVVVWGAPNRFKNQDQKNNGQ